MSKHPLPYRVIGLTGGIASGKSTAARYFAELEGRPFDVLDADDLARELRAPGGAAHAAIVARFGTADAAALRARVFADAGERRALEAILHPLIVAESQRRMIEIARERGATTDRPALIVYEAALLVETGRHRALDGLIVVDSSPGTRRDRLARRDGLAPELASRMIASQIDDDVRRQAATAVIVNEGTLDELRARVHEVAHALSAELYKR